MDFSQTQYSFNGCFEEAAVYFVYGAKMHQS